MIRPGRDRAPPTLARRLGLAIGGMLALAVVTIASLSALVDRLIEMEVKARMPARLAWTMNELDNNRVPPVPDIQALIDLTAREQPRAILISYAALAVMSLIAVILSMYVGARIARRMADTVNAVAEGAEKIAGGDFAHRIPLPPKPARELKTLIDSFNRQAAVLERSEKRMRFQTASVAHEMRTPLTVLNGYIQGTLDGVFPRDDNHMRALLTQVEDLSRIIEDLRTVSLASSGALSLEVVDCDLGSEAQSVLAFNRAQLDAAGMVLEFDLAAAPVRADPARVRQMLLALVDNARRYAAEGGVLSVQTRVVGGVGVLRVADRGPGFPPDGETLAFEWFWRGERSRTRASGGSGLGLAVVKALADAHGGEVSARNRRGGGAVVELLFPAVAPAALPVRKPRYFKA
ncbi:MAG: HAMP domain-containing protein [Caulobacter sp.]|nr:HAMP domain-containing protein [Caulobacter sp.]